MFTGDQKEEEILPIGIDLHHLREVRHLETLLAALANLRRREWAGRAQTQAARMSAYYAQLRREAEEQAARPTARPGAGLTPSDAAGRAAARCQAIDHEARLRLAELRQKSAIRVRVRLASLMVIQQPKLLIAAAVTDGDQRGARLEAVWDPLSESVEAVICPRCGQPTFSLRSGRPGLVCPNCDHAAPRKR